MDDNAMLTAIEEVREKLLSETAKDLAYRADVYSLQEVRGNTRGDIAATIETPAIACYDQSRALADMSIR